MQVIKSGKSPAGSKSADYSQRIQFTAQQQAFLYSLMKRMVIDENNEVAVKRYRDVETILSFFKTGNDEPAHQLSSHHPREFSEMIQSKSDHSNGFAGNGFKQARAEQWKGPESWQDQQA